MNISTKTNSLHQRFVVADMHLHPSLKMYLLNKKFGKRYRSGGAFNPFVLRTDFPTLDKGGVNLIIPAVHLVERAFVNDCWALKILARIAPKKWRRMLKGNPFEQTVRMLDQFEDGVQKARSKHKARVEIARSYSEVQRVLNQKKMAVVHSVEGAHSLDDKIDNLETLFNRGVCLLTLAHFYENSAVFPTNAIPRNMKKLGCFGHKHDLTKGLTNFGKQVVDKMLDLGMLIDVTHSTPKARREIYDVHQNHAKRRPLTASHIGAAALNDDPYNLTDAEIKTIADSGGTIGVIFMKYWLADSKQKKGLHFVVETMKHLKNIGGIDCVAVGSDFDGFTDPPDDLKDPADMPQLTDALLQANFTLTEIEKILGENILRVLKYGWGKQ